MVRQLQSMVVCVAVLVAAAGVVQGGVITVNFDGMTAGSLNNQDGWKASGNMIVGTSTTAGSFDGKTLSNNNVSGLKQGVRPGSVLLNASENQVVLSFTGLGDWTRFGVGYSLPGLDPLSNFQPGLLFGYDGNKWAAYTGNGSTAFQVAATSTNLFSSSIVHDVRLTIDLVSKLGKFEIENSEVAGINWQTPTGMSNISFAALGTGNNGLNPLLWNSLYVRSISLGVWDNLSFSSSVSAASAVPEPTSLLIMGSAIGLIGFPRRRRNV